MRIASTICIAAIICTCDAAWAQPDRIVSVRTPPSSALTEFWSPQRLREATPTPVPVVEPGPRSGAAPGDAQALRSPPLPSGVSGNVGTRPLYWAGKLLYNKPNGPSYCSAQLIAPGILATAAHCVQDDKTGAWFTNFLYAHQYHLGKSSRNVPTQCVAAYTGWVAPDETKWVWDYALIKLAGGADLGSFGFQWGWWGHYNGAPKIGYPQDIEHGEIIQVDFGRIVGGRMPGIVGLIHNNTRNQHGSSGGAWVGQFDSSENPQANFIISVTSHFVGDDRTSSFGPYFDQNFVNLLNYTARGCR
jgi:hypothetical protein